MTGSGWRRPRKQVRAQGATPLLSDSGLGKQETVKIDLITDNWTLQGVNELLVSGLSPMPVGQIAI